MTHSNGRLRRLMRAGARFAGRKACLTILVAAAMMGALCAPAPAEEAATGQNAGVEVGFRSGAGPYSYMDDNGSARGIVGVELCAFCRGRLGLFAGYSHFLAPGGSSAYQSADLFSAGLRVQGRGRVSPFFDVGFAAGSSRFGRTFTRSVNTAGMALGTGLAIRTGNGLYIRPQVRLQLMSELYVAASAEVGVGWRF